MKNTRHHATPILAWAAMTLTLLSGCATPGSAPRPPDRAAAGSAILYGTQPKGMQRVSSSRERISIVAVDGRPTTPWYSLRPFPTEISLEPGRRQVDIRYEHVHGVADGTLWVDARTSRTYRVKVMNPQKRTERVYFLIEDITAQTLVGGESRGDAAP